MKYRACLDDVATTATCANNRQVWVDQPDIVLDKSYFPNLSPSEVLAITAVVWIFFATCLAWRMLGRSISNK
jgi:hypothetical protein